MEVTRLLNDWVQQKEGASDRLLPTILPELRQLAQQHLNRERPHHTLQPTEIVHETFLRFAHSNLVGFESRTQFFAFASRLIRQILVEHARARQRLKRGAGSDPLDLDDISHRVPAPTYDVERVLMVDQGLDALREADPRLSQVAEMRFFAGLTMPEIADVLGLSLATVERLWSVARRRLGRLLAE